MMRTKNYGSCFSSCCFKLAYISKWSAYLYVGTTVPQVSWEPPVCLLSEYMNFSPSITSLLSPLMPKEQGFKVTGFN
jgi:hypothetical protein